MNHDNLYQNEGYSNVFLNVNGWPYISGEYLDKSQFMSVDRTLISNQLVIDNNDPYNSVVDIVIDNVGEKSVGNRSQYSKFLDTIVQNGSVLGRKLDVIRSGMTAIVYFRIESENTGALIRSGTVNIRMKNKAHYLDAETTQLGDSAVLTNHYDSVVKSITNRVSGSDRMIIRLTSVKLFYTGVKRTNRDPFVNSMRPPMNEADIFRPDRPNDPHYPYAHDWHVVNQPKYSFGPPQIDDHTEADILPNWKLFSQFYHFDHGGRTLVLHNNEIYDQGAQTIQIPIGSISLNKAFVVNTSFKILFKLSVWKNDILLLNNTQRVANILGVLGHGNQPPSSPNGAMMDRLDTILWELRGVKKQNWTQDKAIKKLQDIVAELTGETEPVENDQPDDEFNDADNNEEQSEDLGIIGEDETPDLS